MALYIYEFLYRGRHDGSEDPPAWHLRLGSDVLDEFGRDPRPGPAMGMDQAQQKGWGLPEIIQAINADALAEADLLRAANENLSTTVEELRTEAASLRLENQRLRAAPGVEADAATDAASAGADGA